MQYSWILVYIAATALAVSGSVEDVRITIKPLQFSFGSSQDVTLLVNFTNIGQDLMGLANVFDPFKQLMDPIFQVFCNGVQSKYVGAIAKRRALTLEDYLPLAPGASIALPLKISDVFNMTTACNYVVQLQMHAQEFLTNLGIMRKGQEVPAPVKDIVLSSAPVALFADAHRNQILEDTVAIAQGRYLAPSYSNCSATQMTALVNGLREAENYANNAYNYFVTNSAPTARYTTWYGSGSTYWTTVKNNWNNIRSTVSAKTITFNCACTAGSASTYAYVYPSQPYIVYLCGQHWSSPLTGTDSQGGTILHEVAHFTVVAGTGDYAYGQATAKSLATSNPARAIANSDSYQYFSENRPFQS